MKYQEICQTKSQNTFWQGRAQQFDFIMNVQAAPLKAAHVRQIRVKKINNGLLRNWGARTQVPSMFPADYKLDALINPY